MKKLNNSEARKANGGGRYFCKVCGYSNDKYSKVFWHIARPDQEGLLSRRLFLVRAASLQTVEDLRRDA